MRRFLLVALLAIGCSTVVEIGPNARYFRLNSVLAGANYRHADLAETEDGEQVTWFTEMISTWGHSQLIAEIDADSERIGMDHKGASDNITKIAMNLTDAALCAYVPTSCIGGRFIDGIDADEAREEARGLFEVANEETE